MKRWNAFWFPALSPQALGLFRFFFYGSVLALVTTIPNVFPQLHTAFEKRLFFFELFALPLVSVESYEQLRWIWQGAVVCAALGFCTQITSWISFLLAFYLLGYQYNFAYTHQSDTMIVLSLLVVAMSPSGSALSVDAWLRKKFPRLNRALPPAFCFGWALQFMKVLWCFIFLSSVLLKFRTTGSEWLNYNILHLIYAKKFPLALGSESMQALGLGLRAWLAESPGFCRFLTWGALVLELSMPLALFSRRAAVVLVSLGVVMFFVVWLTFSHYFFVYGAPVALAWLPWEKFYGRLRAHG